mmetsp:Transcript_47100/g.92694  ORF Transcript_47100/g.92694 Transcript_47100/m.92694 type:complete len:323 (-) Transcript_47100:1067-2035(-)
MEHCTQGLLSSFFRLEINASDWRKGVHHNGLVKRRSGRPLVPSIFDVVTQPVGKVLPFFLYLFGWPRDPVCHLSAVHIYFFLRSFWFVFHLLQEFFHPFERVNEVLVTLGTDFAQPFFLVLRIRAKPDAQGWEPFKDPFFVDLVQHSCRNVGGCAILRDFVIFDLVLVVDADPRLFLWREPANSGDGHKCRYEAESCTKEEDVTSGVKNGSRTCVESFVPCCQQHRAKLLSSALDNSVVAEPGSKLMLRSQFHDHRISRQHGLNGKGETNEIHHNEQVVCLGESKYNLERTGSNIPEEGRETVSALAHQWGREHCSDAEGYN